VNIPLPTKGDVIELGGFYYFLNFTFGDQLYESVDTYLKNVGDSDWFIRIRGIHEAKGLALYDDANDPRFLLKEGMFPGSSIKAAFPGLSEHKDLWRSQAADLKEVMNNWSHGSIRPTHDLFLDYAIPLFEMAMICSLPIAHDLQKIIQRVRDLKAGKAFSETLPQPLPTAAQEYADKIADKVEEELNRPPVGASWVGPVPPRLVTLKRQTFDITENGNSIRNEFGDSATASQKISVLMKYFPIGGQLRIATDGAIMGYVKGDRVLVGWVGDEPNADKNQARGFFVNHKYEFTGSDVLDLDTGDLLASVAEDSVAILINGLKVWGLPANSRINVSIYGDVVFTDPNTDEERKITLVHKGIWFPGHLPG
jgi:hypothetical protein